MVFRITMPKPGKYKKNTEDLIVSILSEYFPLTLKQIHNKIRKNFAVSVTYQAVRKTVNKLVEEGMLIKDNKSYLINRDWILETQKILDSLKKSYFQSEKPRSRIEIGNNVTEYTFNNLIEKDKVWCKIQEDWLKHKDYNESNSIAWQGMHNWWLLGQLEHEARFMNLIKDKVKVYQLVNGKSYLDKWSVRFYKELGINCSLNKSKNICEEDYMVVFGDYIMQTSYPKKISERLEKFYTKTRKEADIDLNEIMSILTMKEKIRVILIKNREIAQKLRKEIISHF